MSISAFDLDHTLLSVNCSFQFGQYLFSHRQSSIWKTACQAFFYAAHAAGQLSIDQIHQRSFSLFFKGKSSSLYQELVDRFLDEKLASLVYKPALDRFRRAQVEGHYTAILSSSPDFLVKAIALRLEATHSASTLYHVEKGLFSHLGSIMDGRQKASILNMLAENWQVPKENIYAYSDSHLDLPFMEAAGHAVAVRPTRQLRKMCLHKGWTIL